MKRPRLDTERLHLRPFKRRDAPEVQRIAGDRDVAETTLSIPHPYPDGAALAWIKRIKRLFKKGDAVVFAITERDGDALIGAIGLVVDAYHGRAEIGYWIAHHAWGRGYATEASRAVVRFAFEELGLNRIHAFHMQRNPASGRVMQKIGMKHEGTLRRHARRGDAYEDLETYGLLRHEWLEQKM